MLHRWASLAMSTSVIKALPGKLDMKRHSPSILFFSLSQGTMVPGLLYFVCAIAGFLSMAFLIPVPETNKADLKDLIIDIQVKEPDEDSKD